MIDKNYAFSTFTLFILGSAKTQDDNTVEDETRQHCGLIIRE